MWKKLPNKHHANNSLLDTSEAAVGSTSSTNGNVTQNPISVNDKTPKYSIRKTQDKTPLTPQRKKKRTTQEIYTKSGKWHCSCIYKIRCKEKRCYWNVLWPMAKSWHANVIRMNAYASTILTAAVFFSKAVNLKYFSCPYLYALRHSF